MSLDTDRKLAYGALRAVLAILVLAILFAMGSLFPKTPRGRDVVLSAIAVVCLAALVAAGLWGYHLREWWAKWTGQ